MQNIKGTYDYFGREQAVRQKVQTVLRGLFESYDFESMDTTLLNELELLTSKYAGETKSSAKCTSSPTRAAADWGCATT